MERGNSYSTGGSYYNPKSPVNPSFVRAVQSSGPSRAIKIMDDERARLLRDNKEFGTKLQAIEDAGLEEYDILTNALAEKNITSKQIFEQVQLFTSKKTKSSQDLLKTDTMTPEEIAQANSTFLKSDIALKSLIPYLKNREQSLQQYLKSVGGSPGKVGKQGYASISQGQDFQISNWIDTGYLKGSKQIVYDEDKGWGTKYVESSDVTLTGEMSKYDNKEFTVWGTQASSYSVTQIPTVDVSLGDILNKLKVVTNKGKLAPAYYDVNSDQSRTIPSEDGSFAVTSIGANWGKIANDIQSSVSELGQGYLRNPSEAQSVWRDVFNKTENMRTDNGGGFNKEDSNEFLELLNIRAGLFVPEIDYVPSNSKAGKQVAGRFKKEKDSNLDAISNVANDIKNNPNSNPPSLTPSEIQAEYKIQDLYKNFIIANDPKYFIGKKIAGKTVSNIEINPQTGNIELFYVDGQSKERPLGGFEDIDLKNRPDFENLMEQIIARGGDPTAAEILEIKAMKKILKRYSFPGEESIGQFVTTNKQKPPLSKINKKKD